jgi:hypothetical protein
VSGLSRRALVRALACAALTIGTAASHAALPSERAPEESELWVPDPGTARLASLGFRNVVSDYHWIQALQVVGGSESDPSQHGRLIGRLVDVVTALDPWVDHPYRFAALWMTDSLESVRKADALLDQGIAHHPDDWRNPFYQGVNRFLYLDDAAGAADSIERAMALPGSPEYLPRLAARLRAGGGSLEAAALMLSELVESAEDPYTRAGYEKSLQEIETERRARMLDAARAEFQRRHGRDIVRVEELAEGASPVLRALPPDLHGKGWTLDPATGRIVSVHYGSRYEPFLHAAVREERERKQAQDQQSREGSS